MKYFSRVGYFLWKELKAHYLLSETKVLEEIQKDSHSDPLNIYTAINKEGKIIHACNFENVRNIHATVN